MATPITSQEELLRLGRKKVAFQRMIAWMRDMALLDVQYLAETNSYYGDVESSPSYIQFNGLVACVTYRWYIGSDRVDRIHRHPYKGGPKYTTDYDHVLLDEFHYPEGYQCPKEPTEDD